MSSMKFSPLQRIYISVVPFLASVLIEDVMKAVKIYHFWKKLFACISGKYDGTFYQKPQRIRFLIQAEKN